RPPRDPGHRPGRQGAGFLTDRADPPKRTLRRLERHPQQRGVRKRRRRQHSLRHHRQEPVPGSRPDPWVSSTSGPKVIFLMESLQTSPGANPSQPAVAPSGREVASWQDLSPQQRKSGIAAWLGWLFDGLDMHLYVLVAAPFVAELLGAA